VATDSGANILPAGRDVQKDTRAVSKKWWRSFSHDYVLAVIQTKFREVIAHVQLVLLSLGDFDSVMSLLQTLMKERELTGDVPSEASPGDHLGEAIDFEVGRITSENLMIFDGADALEPILRESIDGTDQTKETEV
jgi:hypothetical protein